MKIIGIVGRAYHNKDNQNIIQLNDTLRQALAIYKDIIPILILPTNLETYTNIKMGQDKIDNIDKEKLNYILSKCDGFIIPGGSSWYNFDEYIIKYATANKKPLLAICAGFQCLCSMYALDRDKFDMTKRFSNNSHYSSPNQYLHQNIIIKNTLLSKILDQEVIQVNSLHHDYIDFPLKDLKVSALSEDNIIEAVELPSHPFLLGLQWHPEYLLDENSNKIFEYFINTVKKPQ